MHDLEYRCVCTWYTYGITTNGHCLAHYLDIQNPKWVPAFTPTPPEIPFALFHYDQLLAPFFCHSNTLWRRTRDVRNTRAPLHFRVFDRKVIFRSPGETSLRSLLWISRRTNDRRYFSIGSTRIMRIGYIRIQYYTFFILLPKRPPPSRPMFSLMKILFDRWNSFHPFPPGGYFIVFATSRPSSRGKPGNSRTILSRPLSYSSTVQFLFSLKQFFNPPEKDEWGFRGDQRGDKTVFETGGWPLCAHIRQRTRLLNNQAVFDSGLINCETSMYV